MRVGVALLGAGLIIATGSAVVFSTLQSDRGPTLAAPLHPDERKVHWTLRSLVTQTAHLDSPFPMEISIGLPPDHALHVGTGLFTETLNGKVVEQRPYAGSVATVSSDVKVFVGGMARSELAAQVRDEENSLGNVIVSQNVTPEGYYLTVLHHGAPEVRRTLVWGERVLTCTAGAWSTDTQAPRHQVFARLRAICDSLVLDPPRPPP